MKRTLSAGLLVIAAGLATVQAEIAPMSPAELQKQASHIALGKVKVIYSEITNDGTWESTGGVVEIEVTKLEKGDKIEAGECIYARYWRKRWIGVGDPPPFGSGHHLPKKGDTVRVHLVKKDGGYDTLLPNGIEVIPETKKSKDNP